MDAIDDGKYVTYKRSELHPQTLERLASYEIEDAVVIRRQDAFASPCLLTYASMISMVGTHHPDGEVSKELLMIADYFQRQGEMSGDEARGLPTL